MFTISKEIEFDMGHRVPLHESKCYNPHGHRYRIRAVIEGELITEGPETGMVRDFSIVKKLLTEHIHDVLDHSFLIQISDQQMLVGLGVDYATYLALDNELIVKTFPTIISAVNLHDWNIRVCNFPPTAECLAKWAYWKLKTYLPNLLSIEVFETPTSCAIYREYTNV